MTPNIVRVNGNTRTFENAQNITVPVRMFSQTVMDDQNLVTRFGIGYGRRNPTLAEKFQVIRRLKRRLFILVTHDYLPKKKLEEDAGIF